MSSRTTRSTAAMAFAALLVLGGCATTDTAITQDQDYGQVRPEEQPAVAASDPTPIPGPAKVDSEGRVYTSSAVGSTGNAAAVGTNTNVNIVPEEPASTVTLTETPTTTVQTPLVTETTTTTIVTEPVAPPVIITERETQTTVIEERPMVSSVQTETETRTTTRRRMSKD